MSNDKALLNGALHRLVDAVIALCDAIEPTERTEAEEVFRRNTRLVLTLLDGGRDD